MSKPLTNPRAGTHTAASMLCDHWYGGWCKLHGLDPDPKKRHNCQFISGSNTPDWAKCQTCRVTPRAPNPLKVNACAACVVFHSKRCKHFERAVLPQCPPYTAQEYAARTTPLAEYGKQCTTPK